MKMSDGVISNNRPDTALALGIDYESLASINPAICLRGHNGLRHEGTARWRARFRPCNAGLHRRRYIGRQDNAQRAARSRLVFVIYRSVICVLCAAAGVMAGIIGRGDSGKGQKVETSLMMNALAMQCMRIMHMLDMPTPSMTWYQERYPQLVSQGKSYDELQRDYQSVVRPSIYRCYYRAYRTKDGGMCLGTLDWAARARLLKHLNLEDPRVTDPIMTTTRQKPTSSLKT